MIAPAGAPSVGAGVAVPFDLDVDDAAEALRRSGDGGDLDGGRREAGDGSAFDADEVGMFVVRPGCFWALPLKAPDVIAVVAAKREAGFGEVDQIPVDGRPIETCILQLLGDLAVGKRRRRRVELTEDRNPRGRVSKPYAAERLAEALDDCRTGRSGPAVASVPRCRSPFFACSEIGCHIALSSRLPRVPRR